MLKGRWGYESCLAVDSVGRGGGLALLWSEKIMVTILSHSSHHIDVRISTEGQIENFRMVMQECGFYDLPVSSPRLTWCRGSGENAMFERLDRVLVSHE
ncbi:hypothetical protein DITRI_Ditri19aG0112200 [Diplodiscus trichospermus]